MLILCFLPPFRGVITATQGDADLQRLKKNNIMLQQVTCCFFDGCMVN